MATAINNNNPYGIQPDYSILGYGVTTAQIVAGVALFIISCMAAAGKYSGNGVGFAVMGLVGGSFVLSLSSGNLKERKWHLIIGLSQP